MYWLEFPRSTFKKKKPNPKKYSHDKLNTFWKLSMKIIPSEEKEKLQNLQVKYVNSLTNKNHLNVIFLWK